MNGRRIGLLSALLASGCSTVNHEATLSRIHTDVSDRAAVLVDWEAEQRGTEAIEQLVAAKLGGEMTVDDAVAVSLLKSPRLRALYRELGVAESEIVAAGLPQNPAFVVQRRFPGQAAEYDVTQEFMSVFLIPLRRRLAETQFDRERLRVTQELVNQTAEVRSAYFRAQAAAQIVEMRRSVAAAGDASLEAARALRNAGNTNRLGVAQEQIGANRARLDLADAELEVAASRERLNVLLGLWGEETRWRIPGRLPDLPEREVSPEELERAAVSERLDLASQRAEIEGLAQSLGITNITALIPDLSLTAHTEREPEGKTTSGPSLSFVAPIFDYGQAARARARNLLLQAEDRYAALAIEIRSEVRSAFTRMSLARKKAEFYRREVLPVQETVTRETQLQFNGMFFGVFQLLQARQAQIDAGRDYIQALSEYWLARTELEKALGRRLPAGELRPSSVGEEPAGPTMHHHHGG
jgi:cobalt-zinc-cadmium efflux system outer membrane protein